VLDSVIFGPYNQTADWLRLDSALLAPVGARQAEIILQSIRHNGSNNDGYYDELYFGNSPLVGVKEARQALSFAVFPNPSCGMFNIHLPELKAKSGTLTIRNAFGQMIEERVVTGESIELNIDQPDGIYLITIDNGKEVYCSKAVVQR
jgi:hypothetical protein